MSSLPASTDAVTVMPATRAAGRVQVPGDKSISHRYALLSALADGESVITGYLQGADCIATLACLRALGVSIRQSEPSTLVITGRGLGGLKPPTAVLDAANSGTTTRLLAGVIAAHPFRSIITGDDSLRRRPMRRIIDPLTRMGARIESTGGRPPLVIEGAHLHAIEHAPDVPSAQVKSGVLLAGLQATGLTSVVEPAPTRDHTERALETFGVRVERAGLRVSVMGGQRLQGRTLAVPGDVSSATFWAALAAGTPGGRIEITGVGLNPSRTGMLPILERAGAHVESSLSAEGGGEPAGRLTIGFNECRDFAIEPHEVPGVIDEIPALAALAVMMPPGRRFRVSGASELRVKESDRISALARGFRSIGAAIEEQEDGFTIESRPLAGGIADAEGDHRLAMCFAIAATRAGSPTLITGASSVDVSYPGFFGELARLTGGR